MFCGSAAGKLLPPYVVHKAAHIYEQWQEGGPNGTKYDKSPSGWFDSVTFTNWFKYHFLELVKRNPGKKMLIGDNLRSHISLEVVDLCSKNDILFVCLPPNSTHLVQPLDVGFFKTLKHLWRAMLIRYSKEDPTLSLLNKVVFPRMLKELLDSVDAEKLLPPAFAKCGLLPIDRFKPIERLPTVRKSQDIARHIDTALLKRLEVRRFPVPKKRGKKVQVPAGKSYTEENQDEAEEEEVDDVEEDERGDISGLDESVGGHSSNNEEEAEEESVQSETESLPDLQTTGNPYNNGMFVVAVYEDEWFLAEVIGDQQNVGKGYTRKGVYILYYNKNVKVFESLIS